MEQKDDDLELQLHELGNIPVPGSLLKNIQVRLGQLTPEWANRQYKLAHESRNLSEGDRGKNLVMAVAHLQNVLHVYTSAMFPHQRVQVLYDLGCTYCDFSKLPEKDRLTNLEAAVTSYKEALDVVREHHLADEWIDKLDEAVNECYRQRIQELEHRANVAKKMGDDSLHNHQLASALDHYVQALGLYSRLENRLDEATVIKDIESIQCFLQNIDTAISMGKEVALYRNRQAGGANLSQIEGADSHSHQSRSAVLDRPVHNETVVSIPDEATRATPPLPDHPEKHERDGLVFSGSTVSTWGTIASKTGSTRKRRIPDFSLFLLVILVILIIVSGIIGRIVFSLQVTRTPRSVSSLNPQSIELTISTNSARLLAGDSATITDIQQQVNLQLQQQNLHPLRAAIVLTFAGGTDINRDQQIAHRINGIIRTMNGPNIVLNSDTIFEDNIDLSMSDGIIAIEIYVSNLTTNLSPSAPNDLLTAGTLTVGSDTTYPPLEYFDPALHKANGFDIALITAMAQKMGLQVKIKPANFNTIIPDLKAKHYDIVISSQMITDARKKLVNFVPYFKAGLSLLVQKGNPQHIQSVADLCGQTVGVQDGTVELDILKAANTNCKAAGKPDIKMTVLTYQTDVIGSLANNLVTAIFQDSPVTDYYNKIYSGQFEVAGTVMNTRPEGISIRKGDTSMFNAVQQAFNAVKADGTYDQLFEKWHLNSAQKI